MRKLPTTFAFVLIGFLGLTISACTRDNNGSIVSPSPAPMPAPAPTPTPAPAPSPGPTSAPTISNISAHFSGGTCIRPADGHTGTALVVIFDYSDPNGVSGGFVELDRVYNTGRSEFHDSPVPSAVTL